MKIPSILAAAMLAACGEGAEPAAPEGLVTDLAATPVTFDLEASAVMPGSTLTLTASGFAGRGQRVHFLASRRAGPGPCAPGGSACLDIAGAVTVLGSAVTNVDGVAILSVVVPRSWPVGAVGHLQAVALDGSAWSTSDVEQREVGDLGVCEDAVDAPPDPTLAEWSYHGEDDGPEDWGTLTGYSTCGTGTEQTPIALDSTTAVASTDELTFVNYGLDIPLDLLNNGHTLEVGYAGVDGPNDPQITYGAKTWYLKQFHVHSTSEHTLDGERFPFEIHMVHRATDGTRAVVGVLVAAGEKNELLAALLENDPGHHKSAVCSDELALDALLPLDPTFFHYEGSLTTPPCSEGLDWFVMAEPLEATLDQATEWQHEFHGATSRPIQPTAGRTVTLLAP